MSTQDDIVGAFSSVTFDAGGNGIITGSVGVFELKAAADFASESAAD